MAANPWKNFILRRQAVENYSRECGKPKREAHIGRKGDVWGALFCTDNHQNIFNHDSRDRLRGALAAADSSRIIGRFIVCDAREQAFEDMNCVIFYK